MRLLFWRKSKPATKPPTARPDKGLPTAEQGAILDFARDYLHARGALLTAESANSIAATLPHGGEVRYVTTPVEAQQHAPAEVLSPGAAALTAIIDDVASRARMVSLRLPPSADVANLLRDAFLPPAKGCDRCLAMQGEPLDACDLCPLLEKKNVLGDFRRIASTSVLRQWEDVSVEFAFAFTTRDRFGRTDDIVRIACDEFGEALPPLRDTTLAHAEVFLVPLDAEARLAAASGAVRPIIEHCSQASAAFLRLRGSFEYQRRHDEITGAFAALQSEPDADRAATAHALKLELNRLADAFGADVEARLASVVFVRSPMAEVEMKDAAQQTLHATLDLGRAFVRSFTWDSPSGSSTPSAARPQAQARTREDTRLTVEALQILPPVVFTNCVSWLLERSGATITSWSDSEGTWRFQGIRNGNAFEAFVKPSTGRMALAERDVRQAAALVSGKRDTSCLLIGTISATEAARTEAKRLGVELWDRATLEDLLAQQSGSYERAARERAAEQAAHIATAIELRARVLSVIEAMEAALTEARPSEKLRTHAKVSRAIADVEQSKVSAQRSFLALRTLVDDLRACFGERPDRDGSLGIVATATTFDALPGRIDHLAPIAVSAIREVAATPTSGDFGYSTWRKVVTEELTARCESLRWRTAALDPAQWRDFDKAVDNQAIIQSETKASVADRAATRAAHLVAEINGRAVTLS